MAVKNVVAKRWTGLTVYNGRYYSAPLPWVPALPVNYVDRTYSLPTGGTTWTATSSGSSAGSGPLGQTGCGHLYAFANCVGGDVIIMSLGVNFTPVQLRNITGSGYVYVISAGLGSLPAAGTRVGPSDAANMAVIQGTAATGAAYTATSAHHFRFVGIEIRNLAADFVFNTITIGNGETSDATAPHHILFDRCYVHGRTHATLAGRRGFYVTGSHVGSFDSYIDGYYENGADSQGILFAYGAGPMVSYNNFVSAASENIMLGGVDPVIPNSIATDVQIQHNYFYKPLAWIAAGVGDVKNLFESKGGVRVLVEGNVMENCWFGTVGAGQDGYAIVLTHRNQGGAAPWMNNTDFTIRNNKLIGTGSGVVISGRDSNYIATSPISTRIWLDNNQIVADGNSTGGNACKGWGLQWSADPDYVTITNNTFITGKFPSYNADAGAAYRLIPNFRCYNNVCCGDGLGVAQYDWVGDAKVGFNNMIGYYYDSPIFNYNMLVFCSLAAYPADNIAPASVAAAAFTNFAGGVYSLTGASPGHNAGNDGADMGCDYAELNAAIA